MARFDVDAACEAHAKSSGGTTFDQPLGCDMDMAFEWTSHVWGDGIPHTKMYGRNPSVHLDLEAGTRLRGIEYKSRISDVVMVEFCLNGVWYSNRGGEILDYLA